MKKYFLVLLISILALPNTILASNAETSWKVWKKNSELSVSYRPAIALNKKLSTELIEIKATAKVSSTLSGFLFFIQQVDNTPNWLVNASASSIIKQISTNENIFLIEFLGVWPLKPRLLVLHSTYWQNNDLSVEIKLSDNNNITTANLIPFLSEDIQNFLRIKTYQAHWKITPKKVDVRGDEKTATSSQ